MTQAHPWRGKVHPHDARHYLQQYGHTAADEHGDLIRHKHGNPHERWVHVNDEVTFPHKARFHNQAILDRGRQTDAEPEDGYHLFRYLNGEWVQLFHHVDVDEMGNHVPVWTWPEAHVAHVYRAATDPEYHARVVRENEARNQAAEAAS